MEDDPRARVYGESTLLIDEARVTLAVDRLAVRLTARLLDADPLLMCMMRGGLMFTAALMQRLHFPLQLDYVHLSRYRSDTQGGAIKWHVKPGISVKERCVLLLDDICDEGESLRTAADAIEGAGAREVLCAVLVRRANPEACFSPDYVALECGEGFLIGWGMDYTGYGRNLSGIHVLGKSS